MASFDGLAISIQENSTSSPPVETTALLGDQWFAKVDLNQDGAMSSVALDMSRAELLTLPPFGTQRVCRLKVQATIPPDDSPRVLTLEFQDGLRGNGQPVRNVVSFAGVSHAPILGRVEIPLRALPPVPGRQLPGDANQDGAFDQSDAVWLLGYLFLGTADRLPCDGGSAWAPEAGVASLLDWSNDGAIDLSDAIAMLSWLYLAGHPHPLGTSCIPIVGCPDLCSS